MKKVQIVEKSCHREGLKVQRLRNYFESNGYEVISDDHGIDPTDKYAFPLQNLNVDPDADLIVLTTCGFTKDIEDGDFKALEMIKKNKKPSAEIIMGGCLTNMNPERMKEEFGGMTFNMDNYEVFDKFISAKVPYEQIPATNHMPNSDRFFIQIQDGCSSRCTFCSIWKAGDSVSKTIEDVMDQFYKGIMDGHERIYLIGEAAGSFGMDYGKNLGDLFDEILKVDAQFKLVLEDISPWYIPKCIDQLIELARQGKIESLHSPIQSASDRILRLMGRSCDMEQFKKNFKAIREASADIILSSAVIVGFPTETREELEQTIEYCRDTTFNTMACHMYSSRPETKAAEMDGQISEEEKVYRYKYFKSNFEGTTRVDPNQRPRVETPTLV
ncbi:MAG: radical SAM protein [Candidatus Nitrohelix vancouverensis]|uniref:Radical SAM protein n=1 Tax=Candidatus Nitrohelix vancouverensis TaxID=2705534 RepID=A0A7T0C3P4_9BACT|nr:MAG: radical SAM protein [Candidatus Nitrohelix vancouverensis]